MEENSKEILSPLLSKPQIQKQIERLDHVIKEAQKRVDYMVANDADVIKAIECVERFLRKKKRVCYGGQAINSLLPKARQFYDSKYTVPDYDFFSPSMESDVVELIDDLEKEGFQDISKKLSMHEGTTKIYVNFVPVADISDMAEDMFKLIQKRAVAVDGILFCDPGMLRMFMYLELSRPRGEVERWHKVYQRLTLLNHEYPLEDCKDDITMQHLDADIRKIILDFCVKRKNVMVGPEFIELLDKNKDKTHIDTLAKRGGPVIFLSAKAKEEAEDLRDILGAKGGKVQIEEFTSPSDHVFNYVMLKRKGEKIALIFQEDSCHAYTLLTVDGGAEMRVATPDMILHLYYTLMIFGKKEKSFFQNSLDCLIRKIFTINERARNYPTKFVPPFGLRCSGHQRGIATLLKMKAERTDSIRKKKGKTKTRKNRKNAH